MVQNDTFSQKSPVSSKQGTNVFSKNILKSVVGAERAQNAFQSITMGQIPKATSFNTGACSVKDMINKAQSMNDIDTGKMFLGKLEEIHEKIAKKKDSGKQGGLDAFICEDSDEDSNDSFEAGNDNMMIGDTEVDPSKLIDLELVNLLRYCHELLAHKDDEDYQDEIMLKSIQLGRKTKDKLLIFDMDETLVAAKFEGYKLPGFEPNFKFDLKGTEIAVRLRPYVYDVL